MIGELAAVVGLNVSERNRSDGLKFFHKIGGCVGGMGFVGVSKKRTWVSLSMAVTM